MVHRDISLRTDRVILRRWRRSDLAPFAALNADPRVMEHFPNVLTREESDARAARIARHFDEHGFGLWAVEVPDLAPFIGLVGLSTQTFEAPFTPCIEVGWRIAYDYWGKGYATEAASVVLDDAFKRVGASEIVSYTVPHNQRSRRVMEKLRMTHSPDEDFDHPNVPEGHALRRHVLYRITKASWQSSLS